MWLSKLISCNPAHAVFNGTKATLARNNLQTCAHVSTSLFMSQDCGHAETRNVLRGYGDRIRVVEPPPFPADFPIPPKEKKFKGYFKIARHYGWALNHTFQVKFNME